MLQYRPPPHARTGTGVVELDDRWKADLRKRFEHDLLHRDRQFLLLLKSLLSGRMSSMSLLYIPLRHLEKHWRGV